MLTCERCGNLFVMMRAGRPAKTCKACRREAKNEFYREKARETGAYRGPVTRDCDQCRRPYTRTGRVGRFCTETCRKEWDRLHRSPPCDKVCPVCGEPFKGKKDSITCSRKCAWKYGLPARVAGRQRAIEERRARGIVAAPKNHRAKARHYGVTYDPAVTRESVLERDGWTCQLCGEPIPNGDTGQNDPLYGTLDHIIPFKRGGAHCWNNVQAAHLICNLKKGAKLPSDQ